MSASLPQVPSADNTRWWGGGPVVPLDSPARAPKVIDLEVTGRCQLRCAFCWGADHGQRESVTTEQWVALLERLTQDGVKRIVLTGGEPLLSPATILLLRRAGELKLVRTLSSNSIILPRLREVLTLVDHIGIPLDAPDPSTNEQMRPRSLAHDGWRSAIKGMRLAQAANVALIIRIVAARTNLRHLRQILVVLRREGVDLSRASTLVKVYQVTRTGPIASGLSDAQWSSDWAVDTRTFAEAVEELRRGFPEARITAQESSAHLGRYFHVTPQGDLVTTRDAAAGDNGRVVLGNLIRHYESALDAYTTFNLPY